MSDHSVRHSTIVLERTYDVSPSRVFAAWSNEQELVRWGNPSDDGHMRYERFDFRVGGDELVRFGPADGTGYSNRTRYMDIVSDRRIVAATEMNEGDQRLYVALLTIELHSAGKGCRMVLTEQGVFFQAHGDLQDHESGWSQMLDQLGDHLQRDHASA